MLVVSGSPFVSLGRSGVNSSWDWSSSSTDRLCSLKVLLLEGCVLHRSDFWPECGDSWQLAVAQRPLCFMWHASSKKIKAVTMFLSTGELALVGPSLGSSPGQSVLACKTAAVEAWIHFGPLGSRPENVWCPQIQVLSLRFK